MLNLNSFDSLKNWIVDSGLMIDDSSDPNYGGVYSFYDEKKHQYSFIYPEITGYYASCMRFLYDIYDKINYKQKAELSGNFLVNLVKEYGGIIQGIGSDKTKQQLVYSFDTGICANGLLDCYDITNNKKFLDTAKKLVNWIVDEALDDDGTIKPVQNLQTGKFEEDYSLWYKQKGCLHIKTSISLLHLYEITKDPVLLEKAKLICSTYKKFQRTDGSLSLHLNSKVVHLHSLCYALEGLIYSYNFSKNEEYLACCSAAIRWCSTQIQKDSSIELWFNSGFQRSKTSYAIAQVIRLMILLDKLTHNAKNQNAVERLVSFLQKLQANSSNENVNGGFYEEYFKSFLNWKKRLRVNSWGSMFALQALKWHSDYSKLDPKKSVSRLF